MNTDFKALCEELIEALETAGHRLRVIAPEAEQVLTWTGDAFAAAARASALLAQPEPEAVGPTDEELLSLDQLRDSWNEQADAMNSWDELGVDEIIWWAQCQALARYGHQPAPPAEGVNPIRAALERMVELDNSWPMQDGRWAWKHENAIADSIEALSAAPPAEGEVE